MSDEKPKEEMTPTQKAWARLDGLEGEEWCQMFLKLTAVPERFIDENGNPMRDENEEIIRDFGLD